MVSRTVISLAVPWSVFWMGRIDIACLDEDPRNELLHYDDVARRAVDLSYGFGSDEWVRSGEPADIPGDRAQHAIQASRPLSPKRVSRRPVTTTTRTRSSGTSWPERTKSADSRRG